MSWFKPGKLVTKSACASLVIANVPIVEKESKVENGQSIYFDLPSAGIYTLILIDKESGQVISKERFTGQSGENIKKIYTNSIQSQYLYLLLEDVTKKEISKTTIIIK